MKKTLITLTSLLACTASSMAVTVIDATTNNGSLQAPLGSGSGLNTETVDSTNAFGRALAFNGGTFATTLTDINTITDNPGVSISGWSIYRTQYFSGSDAYGFLENGGRLGQANAADDGTAFANSSDVILVSDSHAATIPAGSTVSWSFVAGSDTGSADFRTFLLLDGTTSVEVTADGSAASFTNNFGTVSGSTTIAGASSIGIYIFADGADGDRSLIDDVELSFTPVPEPSVAMLGGLGLLGLLRRRRRA